jgi:hypothetical protein
VDHTLTDYGGSGTHEGTPPSKGRIFVRSCDGGVGSVLQICWSSACDRSGEVLEDSLEDAAEEAV